jgi:uncharacterized membrane protein YidH (DUF202 family)
MEFTMDKDKIKPLTILRGKELVNTLEEWAGRWDNMAENGTWLAQLRTALAEERNVFSSRRTELAENRTALANTRTNLAGNRTLLAQQRSELADRRTALADDRTKLAGERTTLAQKRTDLAEMRNKLAEIRTRMSGGRTGLAQSRTNLSQYRTLLAKQRTELAYLRTGAALIALGSFFSRYFGVGYFTIIDVLFIIGGLASIGGAATLFFKSYSAERKLVKKLEVELAHEAVEKRLSDAMQMHRFSSF